jgi:hypothetical protein
MQQEEQLYAAGDPSPGSTKDRMDPFLPRNVGVVMILLILAATSASQPAESAVKLCRPVLARKAGGEIATIAIGSARAGKRDVTIEGPLTAFLGMGPPAPGSASAHHLIRADFTYRCTVRRRIVRSATVTPVR